MSAKRIALVGCGGLGREIAAGIQAGRAGNYILSGIYTDQPELTVRHAEEFGCTAYGSLGMLLSDAPDFAVEAAGGSALRELLEPAIRRHIPVIPLSVGVFSDAAYLARIRRLAAACQTRVYLPAGAVGGFDLMSAAALAPDLSAAIRTEKPPKALADAPYLGNRELPIGRSEQVFSGTASEAIQAFPKNVNVAVAVGLATVGPDQLFVTVTSNPELPSNRHTVELDGEFGHASIQISAKPSSNAHSSKLAAYSVIGLLKRLDTWVGFI